MSHFLSRNECSAEKDQKFQVDGVEFVLGGKIGDGAVGLVRRAMRCRDGQEFAVKFLAPDPKYIAEEVFDDVSARFEREGRRGTQLRHYGLVSVQAYSENPNSEAFGGTGPKNPFIVMELIKGRTLEAFIKLEASSRPANGGKVFQVTNERLAIALDVAEGLKYLHQKKLVHRDVKPANIFLLPQPRGLTRAKLGDFGIMKWGDFQASVSTGSLTMTNQQGLGTMKYMSPEQAISPKDVSVRSDIYSLGITLFELFTGQILPSPHHVFEILNARLSRGTTASRFFGMGYEIQSGDESIAELILDMHLRGASGRPSIDRVAGRLAHMLERRSGEDD